LKNDQAFKIRIEQAMPEARYYLNAILEDIDQKYVQKLKDEPEQKVNVKKALSENMVLLAGKQLKFNKKSDA
jgi:TRAP-type C4-dicarboxylate transport system substrate-binding protein